MLKIFSVLYLACSYIRTHKSNGKRVHQKRSKNIECFHLFFNDILRIYQRDKFWDAIRPELTIRQTRQSAQGLLRKRGLQRSKMSVMGPTVGTRPLNFFAPLKI
jgi:hypothetical protein